MRTPRALGIPVRNSGANDGGRARWSRGRAQYGCGNNFEDLKIGVIRNLLTVVLASLYGGCSGWRAPRPFLQENRVSTIKDTKEIRLNGCKGWNQRLRPHRTECISRIARQSRD